MNRIHTRGFRRIAGFTAVELMVAMTLSLVLLAGALSILYSSKLTSAQNEHFARIQEAGRAALALMTEDTRAAGFMGCAKPRIDTHTNPPSTTFMNGLNTAAAGGMMWSYSVPAQGFDATTASVWTPALDAAIPLTSPTPLGGNDVLVLRTALAGSFVLRTTAQVSGTTDIPVEKGPLEVLTTPTELVISDCQGSALIMATAWTASSSTAATIGHGVAASGVTNNSASLPRTFAPYALIQPVQTVIYYVATQCPAVSLPTCPAVTPPGLWQLVSGNVPQELVEGVEGLQVKYGIDTDNDLQADQYVTADAVGANRVVSINLAILVRSIDEYGSVTDTKTYTLLSSAATGGGTYGPFNDRRQRSVFTTTIALRNVTL
jgi:type IV pilus assembly protein PilW